jgi:hypothetical protein
MQLGLSIVEQYTSAYAAAENWDATGIICMAGLGNEA